MSASLDRERLVRVLGMLGSSHDGEVAAAGRAADRLIREAGLRWPDIVQPVLPPPTTERYLDSVADAVDFALEFEDALTDWEIAFLRSLQRRRSPVSDKQGTILGQIIDKARRAAAAEA